MLAKIDIKSAYRIMPVHPDDGPLLGMHWKGQLYVDTCLPFGLRSVPRIFTALADMLEWYVKEQGVSHLLHYLDDYLTMGSAGLEECNVNIEWVIVMLWAAMTLYFYGFLRAGEVVVPSGTELDPAQHLTYADIAVDDKKHPSFITVNIKQSKTDPFRKGVTVVIGWAVGPLCPFVAILSYMATRKPSKEPLFLFEDGHPLTQRTFCGKSTGSVAAD